LIVTAAAGVQLAAHVAEALDEGVFDVRVNIFELDRERKVAAIDFARNIVEGGADSPGFVSAEEADLRQHAGMSLAGDHVLTVEAAVEADRLGEGFDAVVGVAAETAAPGFLTHGYPSKNEPPRRQERQEDKN